LLKKILLVSGLKIIPAFLPEQKAGMMKSGAFCELRQKMTTVKVFHFIWAPAVP